MREEFGHLSSCEHVLCYLLDVIFGEINRLRDDISSVAFRDRHFYAAVNYSDVAESCNFVVPSWNCLLAVTGCRGLPFISVFDFVIWVAFQ